MSNLRPWSESIALDVSITLYLDSGTGMRTDGILQFIQSDQLNNAQDVQLSKISVFAADARNRFLVDWSRVIYAVELELQACWAYTPKT